MKDSLGDGKLFSIWAALLYGTASLVLITAKYGEGWRASQLGVD
jgi:hypothetical protein